MNFHTSRNLDINANNIEHLSQFSILRMLEENPEQGILCDENPVNTMVTLKNLVCIKIIRTAIMIILLIRKHLMSLNKPNQTK